MSSSARVGYRGDAVWRLKDPDLDSDAASLVSYSEGRHEETLDLYVPAGQGPFLPREERSLMKHDERSEIGFSYSLMPFQASSLI